MPICNVCGGYYIRAPCPICTEEHVPDTMSPTAGTDKANLRAEVSIEGTINSSIQSTVDKIEQVKEDIKLEKEKWMSQIVEQKKKTSEFEARFSDISAKEQKLVTNVMQLKERKAKLQVEQNKLVEEISKLEQENSSLHKEKQEKESTFSFLKDEIASLESTKGED